MGLVAVGWDRAAVVALLVAVELPFRLWSAAGVPVGRRTDFYGLPSPSVPGSVLIALADLAVWYAVASAIAAIVQAARAGRADGGSRAEGM
jgi:hypothetical protein